MANQTDLPTVTVETVNLTQLQEWIMEAISNADPLRFPHTEMDGRPGMTAIGVCFALEYTGSTLQSIAVYKAIDELHKLGLLKKGITYTDSVYYI